MSVCNRRAEGEISRPLELEQQSVGGSDRGRVRARGEQNADYFLKYLAGVSPNAALNTAIKEETSKPASAAKYIYHLLPQRCSSGAHNSFDHWCPGSGVQTAFFSACRRSVISAVLRRVRFVPDE